MKKPNSKNSFDALYQKSKGENRIHNGAIGSFRKFMSYTNCGNLWYIMATPLRLLKNLANKKVENVNFQLGSDHNFVAAAYAAMVNY